MLYYFSGRLIRNLMEMRLVVLQLFIRRRAKGSNVAWFGESLPTFRSNLPLQSSGKKWARVYKTLRCDWCRVGGEQSVYVAFHIGPLRGYTQWTVCSAGIAWSGGTVRGSNPSRYKRHFSPKRPDPLWGPPSLLFSAHRCSFAGLNRPEREVYHIPPFNAVVRNEWSYTSRLPIRLHGVESGKVP